MSNKVIELADRFIATWIDVVNGATQIMLAVLDYDFNVISRTVIGPAQNNHGGAWIGLDSQGYLHIIYGPHFEPLRYRRSLTPNNFTDFTPEEWFGTVQTYPSGFFGPNDTLYVTVREGYGDFGSYGHLELYKKPVGQPWRIVSRILVNREPGYAAFNAVLFIDTSNRMHLSLVVHEGTINSTYGASQIAAYIFSDDFGRTWRNSSGPIASLPATVEQTDQLYIGGLDRDTVIQNGTIAVDSAGTPQMLISVENRATYQTSLLLASLSLQGWWQTDLMGKFAGLPAGYSIFDPGIITPLPNGQLRIVFGAQRINQGERDQFAGVAWGHPTNTIFTAAFNPNDSFILVTQVPAQGDGFARWLVNMARPVRIGQSVNPRVAIYTRGSPDGGYLGGGAEVWAARLTRTRSQGRRRPDLLPRPRPASVSPR